MALNLLAVGLGKWDELEKYLGGEIERTKCLIHRRGVCSNYQI